MSSIKMKIIEKSEPNTRTVFEKSNVLDVSPYMKSNGPADFMCGNCNHVILKSITFGQATNLVFKCPQCGEYNQC